MTAADTLELLQAVTALVRANRHAHFLLTAEQAAAQARSQALLERLQATA